MNCILFFLFDENEKQMSALKIQSKNLLNMKIVDKIRVPKVPFRVFDKLKNEIQNFIRRFCFYLNMKNEI